MERATEEVQGCFHRSRHGGREEDGRHYEEEGKKEIPLLKQAGLQVIDLPPAEAQKFLKIAYDEGWKDIIQKNPKTGPELQKLLTKKK